MTLKVGILGAGPSGLLAAYAVQEAGLEANIFSIKKPSRQYGAQWLHSPIPGLTYEEPDDYIEYQLHGTAEGYAVAVYGDRNREVSFGQFVRDGEKQPIWDLRSVYGRLWQHFEPRIFNSFVTPDLLKMLMDQELCDFWISTVPRKTLCVAQGFHRFTSQPIWAAVGPPAVGRELPGDKDHNIVLYNGFENAEWYRSSRVFGHTTTEYPFKFGSEIPKARGLWFIEKPLETDCTCWIDRVMFAGRFGMWQKGVLTHNVYEDVRDSMNRIVE